jgi:corrinoid protein of di/trimethylamine methyltransferase
MTDTFEQLSDAIVAGDAATVAALTQNLVDEGMEADIILNTGLIPPMDIVGERFETGEIFVPEMLIAARAMQAGLDVLRPLLAQSEAQSAGRVAIGTVKGDMHDIGKNLVALMLEGAGFEVIDLGVDVPPEKFVEIVRDGVDVLGLSALLTTTMVNITPVLDALEEAGLRDKVKVIVGGAPLTPEFAENINADGYAADASQAVKLVRSLIQ